MAQSSNAECGDVQGQPLRQPMQIKAVKGNLTTSLLVRKHRHDCTPRWNQDEKKWQWDALKLRTYFYPKHDGADPDDPGDWVPSIPGPTLIMDKPATDQEVGDRLNLTLYNRLPNIQRKASDCEPAEERFRCEGNYLKECQPGHSKAAIEKICGVGKKCVGTVDLIQLSPQCYHGPEVTNVHYHGSHASPQEHQDFVLLKLFSPEQTDPPPPDNCDEDPECAIGSYQTRMDPLTYRQAPGTHWYHPHKHGSTALQVLNGMAGALLIKGSFDKWLEQYYTTEQVIVVHQLAEDLPFYQPGTPSPKALVNGQVNPKVEMYPGEIQRWRFIGATMQAAGSFDIGFDEGPKLIEHKQVAQDGIQFSAENYKNQPFTPEGEKNFRFQLAPGNRIDFLVKAPKTPGDYFLTYHVAAHLGESAEALHDFAAAAILDEFIRGNPAEKEQPEPPLLHISVVPGPVKMADFPKVEDWPEMPSYLENIPYSGFTLKKEMTFGMTGSPGSQPNCFYVGKGDGDLATAQYKDGCAFETMILGQTEVWKINNNNSPNHPFHIHVNPFQLLEEKGVFDNEVVHEVYDPPVWMDTVSIPGGRQTITLDGVTEDKCNEDNPEQLCREPFASISWQERDPRCICQLPDGTTDRINDAKTREECLEQPQPSCTDRDGKPEWQIRDRCRCEVKEDGYVRIVQRPTDFTGPFVIHCHFLGHEDRGMMQNVQTICPNGKYGTPEARAIPDECRRDGTFQPSLGVCTGNDTCPTPVVPASERTPVKQLRANDVDSR